MRRGRRGSSGSSAATPGGLMERFFELSVDLMAISDLSTTILQVSSSFRRIGWEPADVVGNRVIELIHPDDLPLVEGELDRILEGGEAVAVNVRLRGGDGRYRWVQGNAIAALDIERIYFTAADVTAHKALQEQFLDARRQLEERNRDLERSNEELARFAYAAAHDLKAPLARIEMALSAAGGETDASQELLGIAQRGAARMRQLIEDLLTYAAVGSQVGDPEPVDLDGLLSEVLTDLAPELDAAGVSVERSPLPTLVGYRSLLVQLLQNLVENAVKFVRPGVPPRLEVSAVTEHDGVTVSIADNGIGIDPEHRQDVFGVFTRLHADDAYPGSGIGLASCAKVVAHHGGRIWIDDGIGGGTTVRVWLPC